MKEIKRVGFLFCLVSTMFWLLPVIGCQHTSSSGGDWSGESEEEPKENTPNEEASVVSRWVNSNEGYEEILTFYDDGTYTYEKYENDVLEEGQKGTYSGDISSDEETKLTATEDYSNGEWGNTTSSGGFYVKITGDSIEVVVWWTDNDGMEKKGENSSFSKESYFTVAEAAEYISSLTEKGTYYVKVVDGTETSCSALKTALYDLGHSGIYVSLNLSETIVNIEEKAFGNTNSTINYSLVSIILPDSCTSIGKYAFYYCFSLESITIPEGVTSIGNYAFWKCISLESVTIPSSASIGNYAFDSCTSLESVTISKGVTSIGKYAFSYCSSLESITIPSGVTSIGGHAFYYCFLLTSITIPSSVTSIGGSAFSNCSSLKSITIPSSVTEIGGSAFWECSSLESITIPEGVISIGNYTFEHCSSLKYITIPSSVTSIGKYAFYECTSLESITIPLSVTYIGVGAFYGTSLIQADFKDTKGWTVTSTDSNSYDIDEILLKDVTTAADYLCSTYDNYEWNKE